MVEEYLFQHILILIVDNKQHIILLFLLALLLDKIMAGKDILVKLNAKVRLWLNKTALRSM